MDKDEAHSLDDVQRMYIVLRPESGGDRAGEEKQTPDSGKEGCKSASATKATAAREEARRKARKAATARRYTCIYPKLHCLISSYSYMN